MYKKYRNKKVIIDEIVFDSEKESKRYLEIKQLEKHGLIRDLEIHKRFELVTSIPCVGETLRPVFWECDFFYYDEQRKEFIAEDTKGFRTPEYQIKKKLFVEMYGDAITLFENGKKQIYYQRKD